VALHKVHNISLIEPSIFFQGSTSLSAQQQSLQQLQLLQQQLIQQTALMQQPSGGAPLIDANLLAQIQALTNQLLQKTEAKPDDGGFNKVFYTSLICLDLCNGFALLLI
jgi:hypothetical protein